MNTFKTMADNYMFMAKTLNKLELLLPPLAAAQQNHEDMVQLMKDVHSWMITPRDERETPAVILFRIMDLIKQVEK